MTNYTGPDPHKIRSMFAAISSRYDRTNTVLSGGVHHLWRKRAVRAANVQSGDSVLDCATGTGDLAIAFRKAVGANGRVVGTDFVPEMLDIARTKASDVEFEVADVTRLPYADATFDVSSISFGIRNVNEPRKGIAELARVVKPGGRVIVLEFGQPRNRAFAALYNFYNRHVLPRVGGMLTGDRAAYKYLQTSAGRFPSGDAFVQLMRESAQFSSIECIPLTFGIAWLYKAVKAGSTGNAGRVP
ncbi:MAG TPA: bifunctional demethylmenaquinone methyltransferase/2-methoxy-6-polyprenyl-1,4-benzoquinol methylase UbiE [Thermoanaerobaculia bacterium]|nr:bifunctional demethylmenaquinone methyltransferase/2-methoxy-6-polyprenyl-1,4-benzoquinol methylase UbiE [Thermoanaerobaculia bacterium]